MQTPWERTELSASVSHWHLIQIHATACEPHIFYWIIFSCLSQYSSHSFLLKYLLSASAPPGLLIHIIPLQGNTLAKLKQVSSECQNGILHSYQFGMTRRTQINISMRSYYEIHAALCDLMFNLKSMVCTVLQRLGTKPRDIKHGSRC